MAYITYIPCKWPNGHNGSPEDIPDESMGSPRDIKVTGGMQIRSISKDAFRRFAAEQSEGA